MRRRLAPILGAPLILVLAACGGTAATNTPVPAATAAATTAATAATTATRSAGTAATPASPPAATPASPTRPASTPGTPGTPRPAGTPATPGRATPGTPGTPRASGGTTVGTDETNTCQVGVPSGFTTVGGQPGAWTDGSALLLVTVVPMAGMDFATFVQTLPDLIASTPGTTIGATQQSPDRYRADFTADADPTNLVIPYAAAGTFVAVPASGGNACAAELIFPQGQEQTYAPLIEPFVASVRPRQP